MADNLSKLQLALGADASGLIGELGKAHAATKRFQGQTGGVFAGVANAAKSMSGVVTAALGAVAVGGLAAFATSAVKAASDASESMNKVSVVFGQGAGDIQAFANSAAQNLGLSRAAALDAAGGFGNLFTQLGIGGPVAASMSKDIIRLASDFASFHNADPTAVIEAQTAAFRGEFDALQRFAPTINAAAVATKAMEMTGKANAAALTDQEKALAVHKLMLEGAGAATGDFANTSTGMANATRIITASFADIQTEVGEKLLHIIAPLISNFAQALPGALDTARNAFGLVAQAVEAFATGKGFDALYAAMGEDLLSAIGPTLDAFARFRVEHLPGIVAAVQPVAEALGGALLEAIKAIPGAVGTVTGVIGDLTRFFAENELAANALASAAAGLAGAALVALAAALPPIIAGLTAQAAAAAAAALATAAAAAPFIALAAVIGTVVLAGKLVVDNWSLISFSAETMVRLVSKWFDDLGTNIRATLTSFVTIGRDIVDGMLNGIRGAWDGLVSNVMGLIAMLPEGVRKFLGISSPSKVFMAIGEQIAQGLADGIHHGAVDAVAAAGDMAARVAAAGSGKFGIARGLYSGLHTFDRGAAVAAADAAKARDKELMARSSEWQAILESETKNSQAMARAAQARMLAALPRASALDLSMARAQTATGAARLQAAAAGRQRRAEALRLQQISFAATSLRARLFGIGPISVMGEDVQQSLEQQIAGRTSGVAGLSAANIEMIVAAVMQNMNLSVQMNDREVGTLVSGGIANHAADRARMPLRGL